MAIIDSQLLFSDAQALTGSAASTNTIDLNSDRDVGIGEPMAVVVTVDVAAGGTTPTLAIAVQTDATAGFGSTVTPLTSQTFAAAALTQGARFIFPLTADTQLLRFVRLNYTMGGTSPTITLTATLQPMRMLQAEQVFANAYTVQ